VKEYRARLGDYWRPAPLIERLVAEGRGFYADAVPTSVESGSSQSR